MDNNWVTAKTRQDLPAYDTELDELSVNFDFALSAEILDLLYAQNAAGQRRQAANKLSITRLALDEHELALA